MIAVSVEDPRDLAREVPAPGEQLVGRPVRGHLAAAEQKHPIGEGGGELDVVGRDHDRAAAARQAVHEFRQLALAGAVHAARRLVQEQRARQLIALRVPAGHHDGQREALSLAPGKVPRVDFRQLVEPEAPQRCRAGLTADLIADPLVHEEIAGTLRQEGDAARRLDPPSLRLDQAGGSPQQRALAGAVAAHERNALARIDPELEATQRLGALLPLAQLHPHVAEREGGAEATRRAVGRPPSVREGRLRGAPRDPRREVRSLESPPRLADARGRRQAGLAQEAGAGRGEYRLGDQGPLEEVTREGRRR